MPEQAAYIHGHHASVVNSHARRTAQNSAAFLIPHIEPHYRILDVGCGPGSITIDLAQLVPQGSVIGVDSSDDVVSQARELARERGVEGNLTFQRQDANELPFGDGEFDIVYCHQVLHHVHDPVAILKEMIRVTRKGGFVAAREVDYGSTAWYPELPGIQKWEDVHMAIFKSNGVQPRAGRYVKAWASEAGVPYEDITFSWGLWNYQDDEAVIWSKSWADRALQSSYAGTSLKKGFATQEELDHISDTWRKWGEAKGAFIIIPHGEILCRVR
ncbi:ubiE/COQ5 methyltransferase [Xylaria cf. heliscus]|nr:ubiE/COQ5 methyltransferase [Xylaria cf. heliscus]